MVSFAEDASGELYLIDQATTSNTPQTTGNGSIWSIIETFYAGDFNRDGHVNAADILSAEQAFSNLEDYQTANDLTDPTLFKLVADVNGDGTVNNADLQSLENYLKTGHGSESVPEPSTITMLVIGAGVISFARRRRS